MRGRRKVGEVVGFLSFSFEIINDFECWRDEDTRDGLQGRRDTRQAEKQRRERSKASSVVARGRRVRIPLQRSARLSFSFFVATPGMSRRWYVGGAQRDTLERRSNEDERAVDVLRIVTGRV